MTETINTESIGKGIAKADSVLLEQTATTALVFQPQVHNGGVRGWLVRFKKERGKDWESIDEMDFRKINLYDGVKIELGTEQTKKLVNTIQKYGEISKNGIPYGKHEFVFGKKDEVILVNDQNVKNVIEQILQKDFTKDFWDTFANLKPEDAKAISLSHIQGERLKSLKIFNDNINQNKDESSWQNYFEKNKWIFGYGLSYKILRQEQTQPNYGGVKLNGTGGQKGDFLTASEGDISFTVFVEIKKPNTPLLTGKEAQRNGAWSLSKDFVDAITQLQANRSTWEQKGSTDDQNRDRLENNNIFTTCPKGILVIGRLQELNDSNDSRDKRNTFERFRQSIHGIEILTFDELLKRAQYITEKNT